MDAWWHLQSPCLIKSLIFSVNIYLLGCYDVVAGRDSLWMSHQSLHKMSGLTELLSFLWCLPLNLRSYRSERTVLCPKTTGALCVHININTARILRLLGWGDKPNCYRPFQELLHQRCGGVCIVLSGLRTTAAFVYISLESLERRYQNWMPIRKTLCPESNWCDLAPQTTIYSARLSRLL